MECSSSSVVGFSCKCHTAHVWPSFASISVECREGASQETRLPLLMASRKLGLRLSARWVLLTLAEHPPRFLRCRFPAVADAVPFPQQAVPPTGSKPASRSRAVPPLAHRSSSSCLLFRPATIRAHAASTEMPSLSATAGIVRFLSIRGSTSLNLVRPRSHSSSFFSGLPPAHSPAGCFTSATPCPLADCSC